MHVGSGDAEKVWHLPEKLLKSKSTFFTAAIGGGFAEGISKSITLPEEDPNIFQWFVVWLYVGFDPDLKNNMESDFFVHLWALGDRLGCQLIQDDAMCNLIESHVDSQIEEYTLKEIYDGSTLGSNLRRFAVDQCLHDVRNCCAPRNGDGNSWSYIQFVKDNEDFAQELGEATILLGEGEPQNPGNDESPYLFDP